jgi:O-antigen ligase
VQLTPLPEEARLAVSPYSENILRAYDLSYASGAPGAGHALTIDVPRTRLALELLICFGLLLVGTASALTRSMLRRLAGGLTILGVFLAVVGVIQKATFTGKIYGFWTPIFHGDPFGPFVNRNHFAGWMLMALPVSLGLFGALVSRGMRDVKSEFHYRLLWFASREASEVVLVGFAVLVMGLSLVLTMSRSGILGFALALVFAGVPMAWRQATGSRRMVVVAYLVFLVSVIVMWVGTDRLAARFTATRGNDADARMLVWVNTAQVVRDFWLTGSGLNTYGTAMLFYQRVMPEAHLDEAHNDYLQLAAEGGLLVGVPATLTIALFAREVFRRFRTDKGSVYWIRAGAVTGLVAIALQSSVEFSLQMPGNAALFAVLCGVTLSRPNNGFTTKLSP